MSSLEIDQPRTRPSVGVALFVNTLKSTGSWGVGDYDDLAETARQLTRAGIDFIALGPTGAVPVGGPVAGSPYSPQSRLFKSLLHLRPDKLDGWEHVPAHIRNELLGAARRLNQLAVLDLESARDLKLRALREIFRRRASTSVDELERSSDLAAFATFSAAQLQFGQDWRTWPLNLRDPLTAIVGPWARDHREDIRFFAWCQHELDAAFAVACQSGVDVIADLPVGTPALSADAWLWQDAILNELQLGSPPDYFNPEGHRWDLCPFDPAAMLAIGFRPLTAALQHTLRHARGVRIDHAFGLMRQYCLSRDADEPPRWLNQPSCLPGLVAAAAGEAIVVTEELGTAPPGGTAILRSHGFRNHVPFISDQFSLKTPPRVVSLSCHDLPTVAACLRGQAEAPVLDREFLKRAQRRLLDLTPIAGLPVHDATIRLCKAIGDTSSEMIILSPEDLLASARPVNLPGIPEQAWPSFCHRLPAIEELVAAVPCFTAALGRTGT